jgi:Ca2+/Na+ antiporter
MALGGNLMQVLISSGIIVLLFTSEIDRSLLYPQGIKHIYVLLLAVFLISVILHFLREHRVQFLLVVFTTW